MNKCGNLLQRINKGFFYYIFAIVIFTGIFVNSEPFLAMADNLRESSVLSDEKNNDLKGTFVIDVDQFGAVGDGITDDTLAINKAIEAGKIIQFGQKKTYYVTGNLLIKKSGTTLDLNGSRILNSYNGYTHYIQNGDSTVVHGYDGVGDLTIKNGTLEHMEISVCHGKNIKIEYLDFKNSGGHFIQVMSCKNVLISHCSFRGIKDSAKNSSRECINLDPCDFKANRRYGENSPAYDGTNNDYITIEHCISEQGTDAGFTAPQRLGFSHYHVNDNLFHDHIVVRDNLANGCENMACMWIYDFHNSEIYGNRFISRYDKVIIAKYGDNNKYYDNVTTAVESLPIKFLSITNGNQNNLTTYNNSITY